MLEMNAAKPEDLVTVLQRRLSEVADRQESHAQLLEDLGRWAAEQEQVVPTRPVFRPGGGPRRRPPDADPAEDRPAPGPLVGPRPATTFESRGPGGVVNMGHRPGARYALECLASRLRREADRKRDHADAIDHLLRLLPAELPEHVEDFLHQAAVGVERLGRAGP